MNVKKRLAQLFVFISMAVIIVMPVAAADVVEWPNKPTHAQNGVNGFYYMYSDQYNTSNFDTTAFKDCVYTTKNSWTAWGTKTWSWQPPPEVISKEHYDTEANPPKHGLYNKFDEDGTVLPGCEKSMVIKYVAPADGSYKFDVVLKLGSRLPVNEGWWKDEYGTDPKYDGTAYAVYHNTKKLDNGFFDPDRPSWDQFEYKQVEIAPLNKNIDMKKGDAMYFITDQRENGTYDGSNWNIKVSHTVAGVEQPTGNVVTTTVKTGDSVATTSADASAAAETTAAEETAAVETTVDTGSGTAVESTAPAATAAADDDNDGGNNTALLVILIVAGVVVLAGGGFAVYKFVLKK